jgi:FKBP-type peptidyl-prolyl cis-trans isomerase
VRSEVIREVSESAWASARGAGASRRLRRAGPLAAIVCAALVAAAGPVSAQDEAPASAAAPSDVAGPPPDAMKSESGLASRVLTPGTSTERAQATDLVTVHYTGWTTAGEMIDSSREREEPATFPLDRAMAGWRECVQLMVIGETRRCWVPENLAYAGQNGRPRGMLVFDIELIDRRHSPTVPPPDLQEPPADALRTESGLAYKVLRPGTGVRRPASPSQRVSVHYTGWTTDGRMFDSSLARSMPITLTLSDVIPGWTEGVQLMVEGERTRFWIPQELAYKCDPGAPRGMLVFDVELVRIE